VLIVYFSRTGNTREIAHQIHEMAGGRHRGTPDRGAYPNAYNEVVEQAREELRSGFNPALKTKVERIGSCDVVFVGSPNWWGTIAGPVKTFLSEYDLSGKRSYRSSRTPEAVWAGALRISRRSVRIRPFGRSCRLGGKCEKRPERCVGVADRTGNERIAFCAFETYAPHESISGPLPAGRGENASPAPPDVKETLPHPKTSFRA
jgi:flavodoxin